MITKENFKNWKKDTIFKGLTFRYFSKHGYV